MEHHEDPSSPCAPELTRNNMVHKAVAIAAGEAHTLALSGDGKVFAWGRGTFGRLGSGSESDQLFPAGVEFGSSLKFVGVAAGAYHSLALAAKPLFDSMHYRVICHLFVLDTCIYGQLGFEGENVLTPRALDKLVELDSPRSLGDGSEAKSKSPLKVCAVKAGGMMSAAIDNLGTLWMWGNIPQPNSPVDNSFSLASFPSPIPVWDFLGHTVVKVACGNEHIVALVSIGETCKGDDLVCYSWGNNNHGQLGLGDTESRSHPQIVETFAASSSWSAYEVACGAFHTALLTVEKGSTDASGSLCWTFGLGENGQLGHGTTQSISTPQPVTALPRPVFLVSLDCGLFHTSVASLTGEVWSWGMERGLGLCPDASFTEAEPGDALSPLAISLNEPPRPRFPTPVIQVACGAAHTVVIVDDGYKLWSWGRGRSGVLGSGKTLDSYVPILVLWPPLSEDFGGEVLSAEDEKENLENKGDAEEIEVLKTKLLIMERYASVLHGSIFGRPFDEHDIPASLSDTGTFDVAKEWETMLEGADHRKLARLETFYRNMLAGVKDKQLKRRIKEIVMECMQSAAPMNHTPP